MSPATTYLRCEPVTALWEKPPQESFEPRVHTAGRERCGPGAPCAVGVEGRMGHDPRRDCHLPRVGSAGNAPLAAVAWAGTAT